MTSSSFIPEKRPKELAIDMYLREEVDGRGGKGEEEKGRGKREKGRGGNKDVKGVHNLHI